MAPPASSLSACMASISSCFPPAMASNRS
jgi:hypothetical protein